MQADKKIESFIVSPAEDVLYYATISGQIATLDLDAFSVIDEIQAHAGTIIAMAVHPTLSYLACLGMDRTVSVWDISQTVPRALASASIRNVVAQNDAVTYLDVRSNAQAIAFHPVERQIVTRTANGAIAELSFDADGGFSLVRCTRFHTLYDVITARYAVDEPFYLLTGSGDGEAVLSHEGNVLRRWQIEQESIHWFEHIRGSEYLVASDSRLLARIDLHEDQVVKLGPKFAKDDFEHLVFNKRSGRVFASSFDRRVYELDPHSCTPSRVVFDAPFKCRWMHSLSRAPERLIVQVRDGSIFDVDIETGQILNAKRTTPSALWTGVFTGWRQQTFFGEGNRTLEVRSCAPSATTTIPTFSATSREVDWLPQNGYVKRADHDEKTGLTVLGHSSGILFAAKGNEVSQTNLGSAVRDLRLVESRHALVVTEGGVAFKLDCDTMEIVGQYVSPTGTPFWALAVEEDGDRVAVFERHGSIAILDRDRMQRIAVIADGGRCKRAKWLGGPLVMFTKAGEIHVLDMDECTTTCQIPHAGNTVEDFIWDRARNYVVCIGYTNTIGLYDFGSGQKLDEIYDQIDYSKGVIWSHSLDDNTMYPLDFLTYGRSGAAHLFRIHNESIVGLGPVAA